MTEKYKGKHNFTTIKFDHRRLEKIEFKKSTPSTPTQNF